MFDPNNVTRLSIPKWEAVYRTEIHPGVLAIIAVHDTSRGWALGGCRVTNYDNESEALTDVLRLSRGMTFKNAVADLPLGGGKSIIVCDPKVSGAERETILEEFGKFVNWVNLDKERYYTAEDMNTTVADMHVMARHTKFIHGTKVDPSPYTAWGVFCAMKYAVDYFAMDLFHGEKSLNGKKVLIQGLGKVGMTLLDHLHKEGAEIYINDIKEESIRRALEIHPNAVVVATDKLFDTEVDIFAPCARGEVITRNNVDKLKFKVVCGAANNQLQNSSVGDMLHAKGIVYCPDYVANMGGVCCIQYCEVEKASDEETLEKISMTARKMLGLTFRAGFNNNMAFHRAVSHVAKKIVWDADGYFGEQQNKQLFPLTATAEPH